MACVELQGVKYFYIWNSAAKPETCYTIIRIGLI